MSQDASVRIRLDTSGARADLRALYDDMRRAPGVRVPGGGGGAQPGGTGGGGASAVVGSFDINGVVRSLMQAFAAQQMIGAAGGAALGIGRDALREAFLGDKFGSVRGALAARDSVAGRFGLAYQLGLVGDDTLGQMYDMEMQYGAGAAAKGTARARAALGGAVAGTAGGEVAELFREAVVAATGVLGEFANAVKDAIQRSQGGP